MASLTLKEAFTQQLVQRYACEFCGTNQQPLIIMYASDQHAYVAHYQCAQTAMSRVGNMFYDGCCRQEKWQPRLKELNTASTAIGSCNQVNISELRKKPSAVSGWSIAFLKSVFFSAKGSYTIFRIPVVFKKSNFLYGSIETSFFDIFLQNRFIKTLTQADLHVLVHEMGHALMLKVLRRNSEPKIYIFRDCYMEGLTRNSEDGLSKIEDIMITLAGPMSNMLFSAGKLLATAALSSVLPKGVVLPMEVLALFPMGFELSNACFGSSKKIKEIESDFTHIKKICGKSGVDFALMALVGLCVLAIFLTRIIQY